MKVDYGGEIMNFMKSLAGVLLVSSAAMLPQTPLKVVGDLDLNRYAGKWYESARLPNRFQEKCSGDVTADYTVQPDGTIQVVNRCRLSDGKITEAKGVAKKAEKDGKNSVLKVRFAPAFLSFLPQVWGDYQVLALGPAYEYAVVGDPDRKYLWILSRSPQLGDTLYSEAVRQARERGFDVGKLQRTSQANH
ncbi:MAG TPA: lipocalin family protein [Terriglobia bacterium]|nr:lipocalin family protein [Terriglobia bacterium]